MTAKYRIGPDDPCVYVGPDDDYDEIDRWYLEQLDWFAMKLNCLHLACTTPRDLMEQLKNAWEEGETT